jgi:aminopeptidase
VRSGPRAAVLVGTFTCFLSLGLLAPALPKYLTGQLDQGFGMVGCAVALPSVTALLARPAAGRIVDRLGHRPATVAGAALLTVAALALVGVHSVQLLLLCRAVAGVGEALAYVGLAAAGVSSNGVGASANVTWFSVAVYIGLLAGAPIGAIALTALGFRAVWLLAAIAAVATVACGMALPVAAAVTDFEMNKSPLINPAGLLPGIAYGASVWGYTAFNTFIPLYAAELGQHDARTEYVIYGVVLIGVRVLGRWLIERLPPRRVAIASLGFTAAGLVGWALWPIQPGLIGGTALLAVGQALGLPAFLTVAIRAVPAAQRGSALATVTAFFDVGFLTSALGLGAVDQLFGLRSGFTVAASISAVALLSFVPWAAGASARTAPTDLPTTEEHPMTAPQMQSPEIPEADLIAYADIVLDIGVPVRKNDLVLINAEIDHAPFARALAEGAYARGASYVDIWYFDPHAKRSRIRYADPATLSDVPSWLDLRNQELADRHGVLINIRGEAEPDLLSDVDATRAGLDRMPHLASRLRLQSDLLVCWTIVAYPSRSWSQHVFGEADVSRLWQHLKHFLRLDQPDPRAAWRAHLDTLGTKAAQLNELNLDAVHFAGPGTDLTVGLIPQAKWGMVGYEAADGRYFVPCLPSEEVYTSPDFRRVEGTVRSTRPLALAGTVVRDLELTFSGGRVSEVRASTGADVVRGHQGTDHGAAQLGEVALVDGSSPIGQSGVTFMETLLDENATCHLAWGFGFSQVLPHASELSPEELEAKGLNKSAVHTDFMVGGPEVTVTGIRRDKSRVEILRDGQWQIH